MNLFAPFAQNRVVRDLLRQRMFEDVFDVAGGRLLVNELRQLKVAKHPVQLVVRLEGRASHQTDRKFSTDDGQRLQQLLGIGWQAVDSRGENPLHSRRNLQ